MGKSGWWYIVQFRISGFLFPVFLFLLPGKSDRLLDDHPTSAPAEACLDHSALASARPALEATTFNPHAQLAKLPPIQTDAADLPTR